MDDWNDHEIDMIEERARRLAERSGALPWLCLSARDRSLLETKAELELCQESALPSHRHCRGDHSLFGAYAVWKAAEE